MKSKKETCQLLGFITVDGGTVRIGDPCYQSDTNYDDQVQKWLDNGGVGVVLKHDNRKGGNHDAAGAAVEVISGYGDGVYPVTAIIDEETRRVRAVFIDFSVEEQ